MYYIYTDLMVLGYASTNIARPCPDATVGPSCGTSSAPRGSDNGENSQVDKVGSPWETNKYVEIELI